MFTQFDTRIHFQSTSSNKSNTAPSLPHISLSLSTLVHLIDPFNRFVHPASSSTVTSADAALITKQLDIFTTGMTDRKER